MTADDIPAIREQAAVRGATLDEDPVIVVHDQGTYAGQRLNGHTSTITLQDLSVAQPTVTMFRTVQPKGVMLVQVRDAMSAQILIVGPTHTLRQVAQQMSIRGVGSAVVVDPDASGIGIMTERDILKAIGAGMDPDVERTSTHITWDVVYCSPDWSLQEAAVAMAQGGFRHLVVMDGDEVLGVISVRDIMRVWARHHAEATAA